MRKSDLKSGMRVVFRNGERNIIVGDLMYNDNWRFTGIECYNEELKYSVIFVTGDSEWDIMEVHKVVNKGAPLSENNFTRATLLWKRKGLSEQDKNVIEAIRLLRPDFKWIARDEDNRLYAYKTEPVKEPTYWDASDCISIPEEYLQFIQWEDKEPYYIGEWN